MSTPSKPPAKTTRARKTTSAATTRSTSRTATTRSTAATDEPAAPSQPVARERDIMLDVTGLQKYFPVTRGIVIRSKIGDVKAVDGLTFKVSRGETQDSRG